MSDFAAALSLTMRSGTDIHSSFRGRMGARPCSYGFLALFSLLKADQPGHKALACRQERGDARPAQIIGSSSWTTGGFLDMLPPLRAAESFIYHWVESLSRLQMCKSWLPNLLHDILLRTVWQWSCTWHCIQMVHVMVELRAHQQGITNTRLPFWAPLPNP